jgi:hypothetical protein
MKATVVPAQVTTVEDRIAGNLSFTQLILFAIPVFGGSLLYAALPPSMGAALYKLIIVSLIAVFCLTMAIRIKGKIVLLWLIVLVRYQARPRYYLFNKNTSSHRETYDGLAPASKSPTPQPASVDARPHQPKLAFHEAATVYGMIDDQLSQVRFETTKKGGLHVRFTKVEE